MCVLSPGLKRNGTEWTSPGADESTEMSRCPFGVFPNNSLRGVPVPVFGQPDRPYIAIPSAVHDELFARMAQPLDITAKRHTPPFGRPAIPWPGKVAEMEDWTKREGFGKSPRYLADKLGCSGAFSKAGYSTTCSAVGMLETLDLIDLPPSCASPYCVRSQASPDRLASPKLSHASQASMMSESTMRNSEHPLRWRAIRRNQPKHAGLTMSSSGLSFAGPSPPSPLSPSRSEVSSSATSSPAWKRSCTTFGLPQEMRSTPHHTPVLTRAELSTPWRGGGVRPFPQDRCFHKDK